MDEIKPPYSGDALRFIIESPIQPRQPLIENLIYEKTVLMTYADAGAGKSIISLCACLQAAAGKSVFGFFESVRPLKIYYILGERDIDEPAERMQLMKEAFDFNYDNIFIDDELVGTDLLNKTNETALINRVEKYCPNPDIIVLDPIYCLISGELSNPSQATEFAKVSSRIQKKFKCSMWLNNHTVKTTTEIVNGKQVIKRDPFFGSQMLKAHITVSYHIVQKGNKTTFTKYKDSHGVGLETFDLNFDQQTYALKFDYKGDNIPCHIKSEQFITRIRNSIKTFNYEQYFNAIQPATHRYTQKMLGVTIKKHSILNLSARFEDALYQIP